LIHSLPVLLARTSKPVASTARKMVVAETQKIRRIVFFCSEYVHGQWLTDNPRKIVVGVANYYLWKSCHDKQGISEEHNCK
jgi:hypothetical protein